MHHFLFLFFILIFLLSHETRYSAAAASGGGDLCSRRCGGTTVPYPFGFSPGCPIPLSCDASISTTILPYIGDNGTTYRVIAFNSTTSTVVVGLPASCWRSVPEARRELSGGNYGVSSRTGLFLRGGCSGINASAGAGCSVPVDVMSRLLQTTQCVGLSNDASVVCVASTAANATAAAAGQFLQWEKVEKQKCDDLLISSLFVVTTEGTASLEYGVAELGWWLNGTCTGGSERCAAKATCSDVITPSGEMGHRCECVAGMEGDGFVAGDGCYVEGVLAKWCERDVHPCTNSERGGGAPVRVRGRDGRRRVLGWRRMLRRTCSHAEIPFVR